MKTFDELWKEIEERSKRLNIVIVQDKEELRHVFNLMKGCKGYLEIGTAEGNGFYLLSHVIDGIIYATDFGEKHTADSRDEILKYLEPRNLSNDQAVYFLAANSHNSQALSQIELEHLAFDCVLIDAGHTYEDVIADAIMYGRLAKKYIFFHDIQLPPVKAAFEWYCKQNPQFKVSTFINSETFGYGIIEI